MTPSLPDLAGAQFDVVVIGGGINGTAIAREAQRRGYRTLLVERHDFAAGTTSRSTRLIHGGLRYLEHGELGLVYESLAERETLVREAAHLVRPLQLLVPVYAGDARPPWKVRAGLALYDVLSFRKSLPRHRALSRVRLPDEEPELASEGLRALFTFYDAQVEFPERLVIEALRDFVDAGGVALAHTSAARIVSPGGTLRGIVLQDACGHEAELRASVAVNATGPWADALLHGSDAERHDPLIGGTKGSHLVVDWRDPPRHAIFASARRDGRPFFILPWYRYTLVGTTDLRYDGDPSAARCTPAELDYLLDETRRLFPSTAPSESDVLYTYSGVRPLPFTRDGVEASITRAHFVIDHRKRGGPDGLLTVVGGKLTTYRSLARVALAAIEKVQAAPPAPSHPTPTRDVAAPVADGVSAGRAGARHAAPLNSRAVGVESVPGSRDPLAIYGSRAGELRALIATDRTLGERICAHNPELLGQVAHAVEREHAATLADVLLRRLPAGWSACHALDGAPGTARVMAQRLGWDDARVAEEVASYERELLETLVPVDRLDG